MTCEGDYEGDTKSCEGGCSELKEVGRVVRSREREDSEGGNLMTLIH